MLPCKDFFIWLFLGLFVLTKDFKQCMNVHSNCVDGDLQDKSIEKGDTDGNLSVHYWPNQHLALGPKQRRKLHGTRY